MMTGKWHLGTDLVISHRRGFDRFYGTRNFIDSYFTVFNPIAKVYLDDKEVLPATETPVNHLHPDREWYTTGVFTDYALHFMEESFEKHPDGQHLYRPQRSPFPPSCPGGRYPKVPRGNQGRGMGQARRDRYERMVKMGLIDKMELSHWSVQVKPTTRRSRIDFKMALYSAIIDRMDQNIGRVVDKLKDAGRLNNTLILFMVDNGVPGTGVHDWRGLFAKNDRNPETRVDNYKEWGRLGGWTSSSARGWANLDNAPFRMYKRYTHEGGVGPPLIVHWPAGFKAKGELRHAPSHIIGVACLSAAGLSGKGMVGQNLLPVFAKDSKKERTLYWELENRAV